MRSLVLFDNLGPYHEARLIAAATTCELTAVQVVARSDEYAWEHSPRADTFTLVTLFGSESEGGITRGELRRRIDRAFDAAAPEVVFVPGWSSRAAFLALDWCRRHAVPAVAMSESTSIDATRTPWKEAIKKSFLSLFAAALVGGKRQSDYMARLGVPTENIFRGYAVVDNDYFSAHTAALLKKHPRGEGPDSGFLSCSRFVAKKNLPRLLQAYALYLSRAGAAPTWPLTLLGDGPPWGLVESQVARLGLTLHVRLPGFRQYPELPYYYARARAFILASTVDQWGLVVNEAMAAGLPVLVSNRCGCVPDLVHEGENGFSFDPYDVEELAGLMAKVSAPDFPAATFGEKSRAIIAGYGPQKFAAGFKAAAECALRRGPTRARWSSRLVLGLLLLR
jgi:glycosyltransferase involved in cell wall biosynthesis